jgi:ribonuclease P protein component
MLKKINRLSNLRIKAKSQNLDTPLFNIKIFSGGEEEIKIGFVVSKKIDQRAVIRNETKRVLKKAAKQVLNKIKNGNKIIIFAKTKISFSEEGLVEKALEQVLKKAETLK